MDGTVPSGKVKAVAAMLKAIHAQEDLEAARLRYVTGTKWGLRRYLDMDRLKELDQQSNKPGEQTA